jgi:hypothetical protein
MDTRRYNGWAVTQGAQEGSQADNGGCNSPRIIDQLKFRFLGNNSPRSTYRPDDELLVRPDGCRETEHDPPNCKDERERTMKTIYFASICGATLLAVTSFANAQGTGVSSNSDQGITSKQCWDVSGNVIREKNPADAGASSSEKTPKTTVGSTTSGATGSGASDSTNSTGNASARPAGMRDC